MSEVDSGPPSPCEVLPTCPACRGAMELVYDRPQIKECQCRECGTRVTISAEAWDAARQFGMAKGEPST